MYKNSDGRHLDKSEKSHKVLLLNKKVNIFDFTNKKKNHKMKSLTATVRANLLISVR